MNTGDQRFESMISDPEFRKLSEDQQNQLVDEYKEKIGRSIPSHETFLSRAIGQQSGQRYSPFETAISGAVGGPLTAAGGATHAENVAVPATQLISDLGETATGLKLFPGLAPAITTGMTSLAETGRQGIKALRGEGFNPGQIGKTATITGGTELAGRGLGKLFMGKAASRAAVQEGQQAISAMKEALGQAGDSNTALHVPKDEILKTMQDEFSKTSNPMGPAGTVFRRWIRILSDPELTHIHPRMAMEMESDFGNAAKYGNGGSFLENLINRTTNPVKKPVLNASSKVINRAASDMVDNMAENAGIKGFPEASQRFSQAKYELGGGAHQLKDMFTNAGDITLGRVLGGAVHHPVIGTLLGIGDIIRRNPAVQDFIYNTIGKTGAGAVGNTGISEILRKGSED